MGSVFSKTNTTITEFSTRSGWSEISIFILLNGSILLLGLGNILNLLFPLSSAILGFRLYSKYPISYFGFVWWMWFLSPLIRRIADHQSVYREPSPILLAPALVTLISSLTILRQLSKIDAKLGFPYLVSLLGILYGSCVGLINYSLVAVFIKSLKWILPVIFGFHLLINWEKYPDYKKALGNIFTWGIAVMGVYGVYQYLAAPAWDQKWLINSGLLGFQGIPEPFGIRVWSTMDSGEPFAAVMAGGLLFLLSLNKGNISIIASIPGYLSFLLAAVRSGWLGWAAGFLVLSTSLKPKQQIRLVILLLVLTVALVPLSYSSLFSEVISDRFDTFSNLEEDSSLTARQGTYANLMGQALTSFVGNGIGDKTYDSTILASLFNLGWIGTSFYVGGLFLLLMKIFTSKYANRDPFINVARAVVMTALVRIPLNVPLLEASGILFWTFLSLALAAEQYARWNQQNYIQYP